ncbi:MAG: hypothetical protein MJ252_13055, partial [archaeon]|nr:hypothetical protein [archaeon]
MSTREAQINSLLDRGAKLKEYLNAIEDYPGLEPSLKPKKEPELNDYDSLDKIDLVEYSLNNTMKGNDLSISHSESCICDGDKMDIHKLKVLLIRFLKIKFEDFMDRDTASKLNFYVECKVPISTQNNSKEMIYDTFKFNLQNPIIDSECNIEHVSYHKLNMEDSNTFAGLSNSKIFLTLHKIGKTPTQNLQQSKGNSDIIVGQCSFDFNKIILAKDYTLPLSLDLIYKTKVKNPQSQNRQKREKAPKEKEIIKKYGTIDLMCQFTKCPLEKNSQPNLNSKNLQKNPNLIQNFVVGNSPIGQEENKNNYDNLSKFNPNTFDFNSEQIRTDLDDSILVIYLSVTKMNIGHEIITNTSGGESTKPNFYIMHKIFPSMKFAISDTMWNQTRPDFNYEIQMPFILNQETAEMLDNGLLVIELWNKGSTEDLIGTIKFDTKNILDALKVDDYTISTLQMNRNTFPYIIYDDFYQVDVLSTIESQTDLNNIFIKTVIGIGTSVQINNYIQKIQREKKDASFRLINENIDIKKSEHVNIESNNQGNNAGNNTGNNVGNTNQMNNQGNNNQQAVFDPFNSQGPEPDFIPDFQEKIEGNPQQNHNSRIADLNVEEMLTKNKEELENLNNKYPLLNKDTFQRTVGSNYGQDNKDIVNPFLIPMNNEEDNFGGSLQNKPNDFDTGKFRISKENGFLISNEPKVEISPPITQTNNEYNIPQGNNYYPVDDRPRKTDINVNLNITTPINNETKIEESKFSKSENLEDFRNYNPYPNLPQNKPPIEDKKEEIKEEEENKKEETEPLKKDQFKFSNFNLDENPDLDKNEKEDIIQPPQHDVIPYTIPQKKQPEYIKISKFCFDITIEKILNCQILSKIKKPYIKYQFFTDQKPIRSENLSFSSYSVDSSVIDVDMKSTHSLMLSSNDKLKEFLSDFLIEIIYNDINNIPVTIGKVNIPMEEFFYLITENSNINRMLFIYGTEKIKRSECIIGKLKLNIKFYVKEDEINPLTDSIYKNINSEIFVEKETVFNRKIPKNAILKVNVLNFQKLSIFEEYFRKEFNFYFVVSPFGEVSSMEKKFGKRNTTKKYNVLNATFNETLIFKMEIDQDV